MNMPMPTHFIGPLFIFAEIDKRVRIVKVIVADELAAFAFIEKNNNTRTVQTESSKFASFSFDQGFQIVIPLRIVVNVPEPIGTPSDSILHQSDCCLLRQ